MVPYALATYNGDQELSIDKAKKELLRSLSSLTSVADTLVFQLGFCWKGDRHKALFENGAKQELIDFVTRGLRSLMELIPMIQRPVTVRTLAKKWDLMRIWLWKTWKSGL